MTGLVVAASYLILGTKERIGPLKKSGTDRLTKLFDYLHGNPPPAFNLEYREGFGEALSKAHTAWCDANLDVTREVRAAAYKRLADKLAPQYPSVRELQGRVSVVGKGER